MLARICIDFKFNKHIFWVFAKDQMLCVELEEFKI